jgi:hypothetical protein
LQTRTATSFQSSRHGFGSLRSETPHEIRVFRFSGEPNWRISGPPVSSSSCSAGILSRICNLSVNWYWTAELSVHAGQSVGGMCRMAAPQIVGMIRAFLSLGLPCTSAGIHKTGSGQGAALPVGVQPHARPTDALINCGPARLTCALISYPNHPKMGRAASLA